MTEIKSSRGTTPATRRVGAALTQFGRWMELTKGYAAKHLGLHPSDLACLGFMLTAGEPVSPKQIITHLEMTSGTGTALLDRLENAGYIARIPNPNDRRSVLVVLDEVRAAAPLAYYKLMRDHFTAVMRGRDEAELAAFASLLEALANVDMDQQLKALDDAMGGGN